MGSELSRALESLERERQNTNRLRNDLLIMARGRDAAEAEVQQLRERVEACEAMLTDVGLGLLADRDEREKAAQRLLEFWSPDGEDGGA